MEEKPVRKSNWMAVTSLCLGLTGFILSPWVLIILSGVFRDIKIIMNLLNWFWGAGVGFTFLAGPIAALAGIILGLIHSIKRKGGKWLSIPGIIFGILGFVSWGLLLVYGMFFAQ